MPDNRIMVITGPTASGKTALSVRMAGLLNGEVLSADSMAIYRGMDIGTAKPQAAEQMGIAHHGIDIADPRESYSVARYREYALETISGILSRGHVPIVAGGTGLYVNTLCHHVQFAETVADADLRNQLAEFARKNGAQALHRELQVLDPESAARIHPNNIVRVVRAIEVCRLAGMTMTELQRRSRVEESPYRFTIIGLETDRTRLIERIDSRVEAMMAAGLEREVRSLIESGCDPTLQSMQAIGYKEVAAALAGRCTMADAAEAIRVGTRQYAKRQMTWFRKLPGVVWLNGPQDTGADMDRLVKEVLETWNAHC